MPRPIALIYLIVALTGPLLIQAEAAHDFARALVGMENVAVEPVDGGVGDQPYEAFVSEIHLDLDLSSVTLPNLDGLALLPIFDPFACPAGEVDRPVGRGSIAPDPARQRRAWLQIFRC